MKNSVYNFDLIEYFNSYCEVLLMERDDWYGHADCLIQALPDDLRLFFQYIVSDFYHGYGKRFLDSDNKE